MRPVSMCHCGGQRLCLTVCAQEAAILGGIGGLACTFCLDDHHMYRHGTAWKGIQRDPFGDNYPKIREEARQMLREGAPMVDVEFHLARFDLTPVPNAFEQLGINVLELMVVNEPLHNLDLGEGKGFLVNTAECVKLLYTPKLYQAHLAARAAEGNAKLRKATTSIPALEERLKKLSLPPPPYRPPRKPKAPEATRRSEAAAAKHEEALALWTTANAHARKVYDEKVAKRARGLARVTAELKQRRAQKARYQPLVAAADEAVTSYVEPRKSLRSAGQVLDELDRRFALVGSGSLFQKNGILVGGGTPLKVCCAHNCVQANPKTSLTCRSLRGQRCEEF